MTEQSLQPQAKKSNAKARKPRYVQLWEQIQRLQKNLLAQESIHNTIIRQFANTIRPLEESITLELTALTKELIRCFHKDENDAQRSLLGFWIIDNFSVLAAHPFANQFDVETLFDEWRLPIQGTDDMIESQLSLLMAGRDDLPGQAKLTRNYPDADMFATDYSEPNFSNTSSANTTKKKPADNGADQTEETLQPRKSKQKRRANKQTSHEPTSGGASSTRNSKQTVQEDLGELFDIDTLFRRIARAVHPDRELDETKKQVKHAIMSACLQARESNDIAQLLTLYAQHIGDLPDNWSDESTGELVIALEQQLSELEIRTMNLHSQDPLLQLILDRYLGHDTNDVEQRIQKHKTGLVAEIDSLKIQRQNLTTPEGYEDALDERRDIEMDKLVVADLTS